MGDPTHSAAGSALMSHRGRGRCLHVDTTAHPASSWWPTTEAWRPPPCARSRGTGGWRERALPVRRPRAAGGDHHAAGQRRGRRGTDPGGEFDTAIVLEDGRITRMYAMRNQHKLGRLDEVADLRR
jgi:hypothetical protein